MCSLDEIVRLAAQICDCPVGGIALRLGRKLNWDPEKESFVGDKEADGYLTREMRKPWTYEAV